VHSRRSQESFRKLLVRRRATSREIEATLEEVRTQGCCYVPGLNTIFATRLNLQRNAEVAAQFVQLTCRERRAESSRATTETGSDRFYAPVLDHALIYLGSRVLYPARLPVREADYYSLYSHPKEVVSYWGLYSYREYLEMIDFLLLHKDYELRREQYGRAPRLVEIARQYGGARFDYVTRELGLMLGTELYDAYVAGRVSKQSLRALFYRSRRSGEAENQYFRLVQRIARPRRVMAS